MVSESSQEDILSLGRQDHIRPLLLVKRLFHPALMEEGEEILHVLGKGASKWAMGPFMGLALSVALSCLNYINTSTFLQNAQVYILTRR
jgi:hypothetical protein